MEEKKNFNVGDRVGMKIKYTTEWGDPIQFRYDPDQSNVQFGTISDVTAAGKVIVTWDDSYYNKRNGAKLFEASSLEEEPSLQTEYSKLETEFNNVEADILKKVNEAAKALNEANKLAEKTGRSLYDMYSARDALYPALDNAGWSTSSFGC